jgi:hypothetical protein
MRSEGCSSRSRRKACRRGSVPHGAVYKKDVAREDVQAGPGVKTKRWGKERVPRRSRGGPEGSLSQCGRGNEGTVFG